VSDALQWLVVAVAVAVSAVYTLGALLPFGWRVRIAVALTGRVPDRARIWLAGRTGCDACGSRPLATQVRRSRRSLDRS
jgi:hypothetical protein